MVISAVACFIWLRKWVRSQLSIKSQTRSCENHSAKVRISFKLDHYTVGPGFMQFDRFNCS